MQKLDSNDITAKSQGFVLALIGKPGSGKTYIIREMLNGIFKGKYSYVILCSPSNHEYKDIIPETQSCSMFDLTWVYKTLNLINVSLQTNSNKNILLIIDDCIADLKDKQKDTRLAALFFNRRHILWGNGIINLVVTSQKYTMLPARFRSCITDLILFSISPFDMQKIFEESIIRFTKPQWVAAISKVFEKEHNHLKIDIDKQLIS